MFSPLHYATSSANITEELPVIYGQQKKIYIWVLLLARQVPKLVQPRDSTGCKTRKAVLILPKHTHRETTWRTSYLLRELPHFL
jgi:hypothetical protein